MMQFDRHNHPRGSRRAPHAVVGINGVGREVWVAMGIRFKAQFSQASLGLRHPVGFNEDVEIGRCSCLVPAIQLLGQGKAFEPQRCHVTSLERRSQLLLDIHQQASMSSIVPQVRIKPLRKDCGRRYVRINLGEPAQIPGNKPAHAVRTGQFPERTPVDASARGGCCLASMFGRGRAPGADGQEGLLAAQITAAG
jgi:hypothetical protein